jgi:8-oxo-dGTP pyrophosphatase MutT (NUDIX family)
VGFERIGSEVVWAGRIATVRKDCFRYDDGKEAEREIVEHPGAVAVLAHDGERLYLVRQPREAVDEQALLELPAGKLEEGEEVERTARRELAEEVGKGARHWERLTTFYTSPGFAAEEVHLYVATDLYDEEAEAGEEERIEVVEVRLDRIDEAIADCHDSKSLIGLLWLKAYLLR